MKKNTATKKRTRWKCGSCGGTNVEHVLWVPVNEDSVNPEELDVFGSWNYDGSAYCNDCGEHGDLVEDPMPAGADPAPGEEAVGEVEDAPGEDGIPVHIEREVTVETRSMLRLDGEDILQLLGRAGIEPKASGEVTVAFKVPGGGDWSNEEVDVSEDHPVVIRWTRRRRATEVLP